MLLSPSTSRRPNSIETFPASTGQGNLLLFFSKLSDTSFISGLSSNVLTFLGFDTGFVASVLEDVFEVVVLVVLLGLGVLAANAAWRFFSASISRRIAAVIPSLIFLSCFCLFARSLLSSFSRERSLEITASF